MFKLTYDNKEVVNANNEDWRIQDIQVGAIHSVIRKEHTNGSIGEIYYGQRPAHRQITIVLEFSIDGIASYYDKQREIKKKFRPEPSYLSIDHYIDEEPTHLRVTRTLIDFQRSGMVRGYCTLVFENIGLPYFESVEHNNFTPTTNIFTFNNKGDIPLDDRFTDTTFEIDTASSITNLEIHVNDERVWRLNGVTALSSNVEIKDGTTFLNGTDVIDRTDKGIVKLPVGESTIQKHSQSSMTISTRFYYE